ncbi:MAG: hypothetical protein FWD71_07595 [Oscillospiraceae bacterium]|nr:hypothetical protein [Oscillospiraceae bacterium]
MAKQNFTQTAYKNLSDFMYGKSLYPVELKNGMSIGGGTVYPEINFTLPTITAKHE